MVFGVIEIEIKFPKRGEKVESNNRAEYLLSAPWDWKIKQEGQEQDEDNKEKAKSNSRVVIMIS